MAFFVFGPFRLDTETGILFTGSEATALGRRAAGLLQHLLEAAGQPVSKTALIEQVWRGMAVEDSNLSIQVAALRKVLEEATPGERWIETLPRRGYRYSGPAPLCSDVAEFPT